MPKHKLHSNSFPKERDAQSGQYTAHCSCINHDEWSSNYICKEINIKKSSRFGKNIASKFIEKDIYHDGLKIKWYYKESKHLSVPGTLNLILVFCISIQAQYILIPTERGTS